MVASAVSCSVRVSKASCSSVSALQECSAAMSRAAALTRPSQALLIISQLLCPPMQPQQTQQTNLKVMRPAASPDSGSQRPSTLFLPDHPPPVTTAPQKGLHAAGSPAGMGLPHMSQHLAWQPFITEQQVAFHR